MKKIIALSSLLFVLLMTVLPANISHAAAATNPVTVSGISLVLQGGETIKATKVGNDFELNLVGDDQAYGDQMVEKVEITSDTAVTLSALPANFNYSLVAPLTKDDFDIQFVNGKATLDLDKTLGWLQRVSTAMGSSIPTEQLPTQMPTINEIKNEILPLLSGLVYEKLGMVVQSPYTAPGYVVDKDGNESTLNFTLVTEGWKYENNHWKYYYETGEFATGWFEMDNNWYYLAPTDGVMQTGPITDNLGRKYILDTHGVWINKTGWVYTGGKWYLLNKDSQLTTGWAQVNGKYYYLNANGVMATGPITDNTGRKYLLNQSGAWVVGNGWVTFDNKWYYLNKNSELTTGWLMYKGSWYFLNTNGAMQTGWAYVNNKWYYLKSSGAMATGWAYVNNKWYYLDGSGAMKTGWVKVSNKWYYLYSDGHMAANTRIDSYYVDKSGAWVPGK